MTQPATQQVRARPEKKQGKERRNAHTKDNNVGKYWQSQSSQARLVSNYYYMYEVGRLLSTNKKDFIFPNICWPAPLLQIL